MRVLGIDPGLTNGGFAVVEIASPRVFNLLGILDIPTFGDEHRKRVDVLKLAAWLRPFRIDQAIIERAQLMPSLDGKPQGVSSGGKYMRAVGAIEATVILTGSKLSTVEPSVWKRHYGIKGGKENKDASRLLALKFFPEWEKSLARKKDHNRAEAVLIARFAALHFGSIGESKEQPLADTPQLALWREGDEGEPDESRTVRRRHALLR